MNMGDKSLDDELALFESEISSLVESAKMDEPPTKKKRTFGNESREGEVSPTMTPNGTAVITAPPVLSASPMIRTISASPTASFAAQLSSPSLSMGLSMVPPPVPPPIFIPNQHIRPSIPSMPMTNIFVPHQIRIPPRPSATIESGPAIYNTEASSSQPTSTLPHTVALASDIEAMENKKNEPHAVVKPKEQKEQKPKKFIRAGGGQVWEDPSLAEWDRNDFRIFCGDLGNEVSDELLAKAFRKYPSFQKAKVVRDSRSNKSKGYGFVSFAESEDYVRAIREMDGKYVGNRPIKLRKSNWKDRNLDTIKKKQKQKAKLGLWG